MDHQKWNRQTIEKFDITFKNKPKDGVILQLHHTVKSSSGKSRRIRFNTGTFDDVNDKLASTDNNGNLFILDFSDCKFWKLTHIGLCSSLLFMPEKVDYLLVATVKKNSLLFMDIETGEVSLTLTGHMAPIMNMSFSSSKISNLLTASPSEAILWETTNYTKYFTLNTYLGTQIQQILFTPSSDCLVACFQNDTIQIWKHDSMKSLKQIIPSELKHMKSIVFTRNGRAMVMAGLCPLLILFNMDTWKAIKTIDLSKYNITGVQDTAFIPQVFDGGANKILAMLSSDCKVHIFDIEQNNIIHTINLDCRVRKLIVSPTGKYFLCILQLGEVNIYNSSFVMEMASEKVIETPSCSHRSKTPRKIPLKADVEAKMRNCMDSARLRRILMQYGEYPEKFRTVIWQSLLDTPKNKTAYTALLDKGVHASYKEIEKQFTIHSSVTLKNLKRLLSCLAHWCPLFAVIKFLPAFLFPFVKVLQKDPLLLFESVATILINYCQLWFEYAPLPPFSVLSIIENIIAEHDKELLDHFCKIGVTSQTYALIILETAFSEVLSCSEWLILWDHIMSNEPSFILMAVASYNIIQRNALKKLNEQDDFENFYHMQNPINKKHFLKKAYVLLNDTSEDIHPKRFLSSFVPLDKGSCYQQFSGYPKATVCMKLAKKEKKAVERDSKGLTLRELTKKCQEEQIHERCKSDGNTHGTDIHKNKSFKRNSVHSCDRSLCKSCKNIPKRSNYLDKEVKICYSSDDSTSD